MSNIFCPPPPVLSEEHHKAAYYKWCLNAIVYDYLFAIKMYREGGVASISEKSSWSKGNAILNSLLVKLFDKGPEDGDAWDGIWTTSFDGSPAFDSFKDVMNRTLSEAHCGDCTYVSGSCIRCHTESLYDLPSSVTWSNKNNTTEPPDQEGKITNE